MKIHRATLWVEGIFILIPLCITAGLIFIFSIGLMIMTISENEYLAASLQFVFCCVALFYLTKVLFQYLLEGPESIVSKIWLVYVVLFVAAAAISVLGLFEQLYMDSRRWEQSIIQYWPGREFLKVFIVGLPAVLPATHVSVLLYRANVRNVS